MHGIAVFRKKLLKNSGVKNRVKRYSFPILGFGSVAASIQKSHISAGLQGSN